MIRAVSRSCHRMTDGRFRSPGKRITEAGFFIEGIEISVRPFLKVPLIT